MNTGKDAPLEVVEAGVASRGVFAKAFILKCEWLCEYKTTAVYTIKRARDEAEEEYRRNQEGCTSCSAKRSFSGLKRIKTALRSIVGNECLPNIINPFLSTQ